MSDPTRIHLSAATYAAVVIPVVLPYEEPDPLDDEVSGSTRWERACPYVDTDLGMSPGLYPTEELDPVCQSRAWVTPLGCLSLDPSPGATPASVALVQTDDPDRRPGPSPAFGRVDPGITLIVEAIVDLPTHRAIVRSVKAGTFTAALPEMSVWHLVTHGLPRDVAQDDEAPLRDRLTSLTVAQATRHWTSPSLGRATGSPMPTQGMVVTICAHEQFAAIQKAYGMSAPETWGAGEDTMPVIRHLPNLNASVSNGSRDTLQDSALRKLALSGQDHVAGWVTDGAFEAMSRRMTDNEFHPYNDHEIDAEESDSVSHQVFALAFLLSTLADAKCQMERWRMWLSDAYSLLHRTKAIAVDSRSRRADGGTSDIEQECMVLLMDINDYRVDNWRLMRDLESGQVASDTTCGGLSPALRTVMTGWIAEQPTPTTIVEDSHSLMSSWMQSRLTYWSRMSARQSARTARLLQVASAVLGMVALLGLSAAIAAVPQSDTVFYPWVRAVFVTILIAMALVVFALVIWKLIDMAPPRPPTRRALGFLAVALAGACGILALLGAFEVINTAVAVAGTIVTLVAASLLILYLLDSAGSDRVPEALNQGLAD